MPSMKQNEAFVQSLLPAYPLDDAIEWIEKNMDPDDVFSEGQLERWAINCMPVDHMPEDELIAWAEKNGFTKV